MGNGPHFANREQSNDPQITKVRTLHGEAAPQPDQGTRTPDSGADGCASLEGRGTLGQK